MGLIRPLLQNPLPSPSSSSSSSSPTSIMEVLDEAGRSSSGCRSSCKEEDVADLRRGPWTVDEDLTLINHIAIQGEGRWNSLARNAGLKRTGKSCRLRWLNYLCPDVRRGNITLEEQLLILELHSRWGNQWSKIAQQLPGRTDNEIKNYWRTRVQKHARQLKCDTGSSQFREAMKYLWMPWLTERTPTSAGMTFSAEGSTMTSATSMCHLAEISVRSYTGTDPENSCTTASSSEHPFYTTHEVSAPNNNKYYPVVAIDDSCGSCSDERWNQQGQSGHFHQHDGYYHRQQLESGMEFRAVDDHHRQQNHHNNSNDQIQRCWWSGHGGESSDNIWNNVAEDFDQWYSQNSRFDP